MVQRRTPTPEELGRQRPRSTRMVTFRLSDPQLEELRALARRAGLGSSALARRIVEHYIAEHGRGARRGRK